MSTHATTETEYIHADQQPRAVTGTRETRIEDCPPEPDTDESSEADEPSEAKELSEADSDDGSSDSLENELTVPPESSAQRLPTNKRFRQSEATAQKRKRTTEEARPTGKISTASKLPTIPEFGSFTPTSQLGEFRDWIKLVRSALRFAPDWSEQTTVDWFDIICGKSLRVIISSFHLEPTDIEKPFSDLVKKLDDHFCSVTDPSLDHQALAKCKQEPGETANDFYVRLAQLVRHMRTDPEHIRTHYMLNLRDGEFRNLAITNRWSLLETVAAATRNESLRATSQPQPSTSALGTGEVAAVSEHRNRHPTRASDNRSRSNRGPANQSTPRPIPTRGNPVEYRNPLACRDCGISSHRTGTCPAKGKQCINCGKWGHFRSVCPEPMKEDPRPTRFPKPAQNSKPARVNQVNNSSDWSD